MKTMSRQGVQAQFVELLDEYLSTRPHALVSEGAELAVNMRANARNPTMPAVRPTLKALLLSDFARTEHLTPASAEKRLPTPSSGRR